MTETLRRAGLEPVGSVGPATDGPRRTARDADGGVWVVTVVPSARAPAARDRVALLQTAPHAHVATPERCVDLDDGSLAVLQPVVPGADLTTVLAARGAWSPGEVVTVVVPLADALATLHAVGLAHGDVAPGNVVLRPDGRPVLVDVVRGTEPGECGTPLTAAPERPAGATAAADVHALGRLGLVLLGGVAGRTDPGLAAVARALHAACRPDPADRPSAAELAGAVYAACPPAPIRLPDAAVLARLALRRLAGTDDAPETLRRPLAVDGTGAVGGDALPTRPRRGRHRHRRRHRGGAPARAVRTRLAAVAAAVAVAGVGALAVAADGAVWPRHEAEGSAVSAVAGDPAAAAVRLTRARASALAAGRPAALTALTVPGSTAWLADRRAGAMAVGRGPVPGAHLQVVAVGRLAGPPCPTTVRRALPVGVGRDGRCPAEARVRLVTAAHVPGSADSRDVVVLALARWGGAWRVSAVTRP